MINPSLNEYAQSVYHAHTSYSLNMKDLALL